MMAGGACFLTGTVLVTLAVHMVMLVLGRIVLGIGVGFATQVGCRTVSLWCCVWREARCAGAPLGHPSVASPPSPAGPLVVRSSKQRNACDCSVWWMHSLMVSHGWCWWCCLPAGHPSLLVRDGSLQAAWCTQHHVPGEGPAANPLLRLEPEKNLNFLSSSSSSSMRPGADCMQGLAFGRIHTAVSIRMPVSAGHGMHFALTGVLLCVVLLPAVVCCVFAACCDHWDSGGPAHQLWHTVHCTIRLAYQVGFWGSLRASMGF